MQFTANGDLKATNTCCGSTYTLPLFYVCSQDARWVDTNIQHVEWRHVACMWWWYLAWM